MNRPVVTPSRIGMVGIVVAIGAVVAAACSSPGAIPSSRAGSNAAASASPKSSGAPPLTGDALEPGTYALGYDLNGTITVPAGWDNLDNRGVAKGDDATFQGVVFWPFPSDLAEVYTNPCHWADNIIDPPVGPTVDDLANALATQSMRGDPTPMDVTLDGYQGKLVEMSVPDDVVIADCDEGEFRSWNGRFHQGPGQIDDVYILDVDGERQVLIVHHMPGVTEANLAEQQAILTSISFLN